MRMQFSLFESLTYYYIGICLYYDMETLRANVQTGNRKSVIALDATELRARITRGDDIQLVDVREYPEYASGHIADSRRIPLGGIKGRTSEIDANKTVVCICRSGKRAAQAAGELSELGFQDIATLEGGLRAWEQAGFPVQKHARAPWALERQVRFTAGLLILAGLGLSLVWPAAIGLSWFVGAGLVFAAVIDWCGMGLLLAKAPWNRQAKSCKTTC